MTDSSIRVEVKKHGFAWINHGTLPSCPECNCCDIEHSNVRKFKGDYIVDCTCTHCGCEFQMKRKAK